MPMVLFHSFFPKVAEVETRTITLPRRCLSLPADTYAFLDLYCDEVGCRCENAMITVVDGRQRHLATINHSLGPGGAFGDSKGPRTYLDPLNRQSALADDILALFEQVVCTPEYEARLRRHRSMVRERVDGAAPRARPGERGAD